MIKHKICMLGSFSVGKTSLVSRYVHSIFSDRYLTTVGVKVDKKVITREGDEDVTLLLWDVYGEDGVHEINTSYLRGMSGYLLVADGTRTETLDTAMAIRQRVESTFGELPFVLLLNKCDRSDTWKVDDDILQPWRGDGVSIIETSAKTGTGVEPAFVSLVDHMVKGEMS